jgi:ribosomal protein S16
MERAQYWLGKGAQPTETVRRLIKSSAKAAAAVETQPEA